MSSDGLEQFEDIEVVSFEANYGIQAANLSGGVGFTGGTADSFDGLILVDYDDVVDRNEELVLLEAQHLLVAFVNSSETLDGTVTATASISAGSAGPQLSVDVNTDSLDPNNDIVGGASQDDSIDIIGRNLKATAHAPFSDGGTGVGGGGSAGEDRVEFAMPPAEMGRFHPRDELFLNGHLRVWNIQNAGVHARLQGQHWYGVVED